MSFKLLDLFCGAGGCSMGYWRAGFEVVGVDNKPQKQYPFEFHQADALSFSFSGFDAIHASPPCQAHCSLWKMWNAKKHVSLIEPTRRLLQKSGLPYVIENVPGAPLINPTVLCGTMFDLGCAGAELRRHRLFETNWPIQSVPHCRHGRYPLVIGVYGGHGRDRRRTKNTQNFSTDRRREAMGISWMNGTALSQAIPPAYTEWIGKQLIAILEERQ